MKLKDLFESKAVKLDYSLRNIHKKNWPTHNGVTFIPKHVRSHILGLMLIKDVRKVIIMPVTPGEHVPDSVQRLEQAIKIINKHLAGNRNIHECQEELIEAGLKEFARL